MSFPLLLEALAKQELFRLQAYYVEKLSDAWNVEIKVGDKGTPELELTRPGKINDIKVLIISDVENLELHSTLSDHDGDAIAYSQLTAETLQELTLALCRIADLGVKLSSTKKVSGFKADLHQGNVGAIFDHSRFGGIGCWFVKDTLRWNVTVQGYKSDVDMGTDMSDDEVLEAVKTLSLKWMRENDPHGDMW